MDFNQIYQLRDKDIKGAFNSCGTNIKIEHVNLFKGEIELKELLNYDYNFGTKLYDLINSGFAGIYLLSNKVINLLKENQISGWMTYPCNLFDKQKNEVLGYSLFSVKGRCGPIDRLKSERHIKQYTQTGKPVDILKGLYFEMDTWDGSDIFSPEGTLYTFVNEKVKEILIKNKVTNILFDRITDIETIQPKLGNDINPDLMKYFGFD